MWRLYHVEQTEDTSTTPSQHNDILSASILITCLLTSRLLFFLFSALFYSPKLVVVVVFYIVTAYLGLSICLSFFAMLLLFLVSHTLTEFTFLLSELYGIVVVLSARVWEHSSSALYENIFISPSFLNDGLAGHSRLAIISSQLKKEMILLLFGFYSCCWEISIIYVPLKIIFLHSLHLQFSLCHSGSEILIK